MKAALVLSVVLCAVVAAGCGGGSGSHTYVLTPSATGAVGARGAGIYLTIVSPSAFPQSLFDAMRPKMTVVAQPAGPEVCSYVEGNWQMGDWYDGPGRMAMVTVTVSGSNPLAAALCSGESKRPSTVGPTGASYPSEVMGPTGIAGTSTASAAPSPRPAPRPVVTHAPWPVSIAPVVVTAAQLWTLSQLLDTPIYWTGPQSGYRYQFSSKYDEIWIRYLPSGASAGATDRRFRVVGTYSFPGAGHQVRRVARGKAVTGPRGSISFRVPTSSGRWFRRHNLYLALRGVPAEIEVFDPRPGVAATIAASGWVRRVGR